MAKEAQEETARPVIVDVGKVKRKLIRQLKKGRGRLPGEISQVVDEVRRGLGEEAEEKTLLPIVLIYRQKDRKRKDKGRFPFFL